MKEQAYTLDGKGCCIRVGRSGNSFRGETNSLELQDMFKDWLKKEGKWEGCRFGYCNTWEEAQRDIDAFAVANKLCEHTVPRVRFGN